MLKVGLTGSIGSGKSTVVRMLAGLGAFVIEADAIARELMQPGKSVFRTVVEHFGPKILDEAGSIDRRRLADAAFGEMGGSGPRVQELNELVHPAVIGYQDEWMEQVGREHPGAVAVVEAALLLEAGAARHFDRIVVVTCPVEERVRRWAARTGTDVAAARRELQRRLAAQWSEEAKVQMADFVIANAGPPAATEAQVRELYRKLAAEAAAGRVSVG